MERSSYSSALTHWATGYRCVFGTEGYMKIHRNAESQIANIKKKNKKTEKQNNLTASADSVWQRYWDKESDLYGEKATASQSDCWMRTAETAFCSVRYNTKGIISDPLNHTSTEQRHIWSRLKHQLYIGSVSLLACKCAAVTDKVNESSKGVSEVSDPQVKRGAGAGLVVHILKISGG